MPPGGTGRGEDHAISFPFFKNLEQVSYYQITTLVKNRGGRESERGRFRYKIFQKSHICS